jgi:TIR domain-containing protein
LATQKSLHPAKKAAARAIARPTFDAFISHASADALSVKRLVRALEADSLTTWTDYSAVAFGKLLRPELHQAIRNSRVFVLLWSKGARRSRWVMMEIIVAFHLKKFIIPCVLDDTPLPQFLANAAYLDRGRERTALAAQLSRAIRTASAGPTKVAPLMVGRTKIVDLLSRAIGARQYAVLEAVTRDRKHAAAGNRSVGTALRHLQDIAPEDPLVLNLTAYQYKNTYMLKYWPQIQAGRAPEDRLLARAERNFFDVLSGNPSDESAINGLGTVLFYERELEAAAFFQRRAAALAKRRGMDYQAAKSDLQQTLQHMRQQR